MATDLAARRLRKEYMAIRKKPVENILALPWESNILEWHYVIIGTTGTPYEGGYYHGKLKFPPEYPLKPPSVMMYTPNGRFHTNRRLCLSMSDFHPETWNPMWSVSSILTGLYSFMLDNTPTLGSMESSDAKKRQFAKLSLAENCKSRHFCTCFPDLVELHRARTAQAATTQKDEAKNAVNSVAQNQELVNMFWTFFEANRSAIGCLVLSVAFVLAILLQW